MADIILDKEGPTLHRWKTAIKDPAFNLIRPKVVVTTLPDDFLAVLRAGTVSTNVYLRRLQNHCLDLGWLPVHILPKKKFPKIEHKVKRAITWDEHCRIIAREGNPERRDFYELCWYFGGSQSDVAGLHAEDLDYERRCFAYDRPKTGNMGAMRIGGKAWEVHPAPPALGPAVSLPCQRAGSRPGDRVQTAVRGLGHQGHDPSFVSSCLGRTLRR